MPRLEFKIYNPCPKISYEMYSEYYENVLIQNKLKVLDKETKHSSEDGSFTFKYNVKGKRRNMKKSRLMSHFNKYGGKSLVNIAKNGEVEEIVNQYPSDIKLTKFRPSN